MKTHFTVMLTLLCVQWRKNRIHRQFLSNPTPTPEWRIRYQLRYSESIIDTLSLNVDSHLLVHLYQW